MLFVDLAGVRNVVPIIDSGETDSKWVLVMPLAELSLRHHLESPNGPMLVSNVTVILTDITPVDPSEG